MAYLHPELPPDDKAAYDRITGQKYQSIMPSANNLDVFAQDTPQGNSQLLQKETEAAPDMEKNRQPQTEPKTEIVKDLGDSARQVTPAIERLPGRGTRIFVSKDDLPVEIVVVDADSKLKVYRN
jgi:hypothetical protein